MLSQLDAPTRALVRFAAAIACGTEELVRREAGACRTDADHAHVEEIILQSYLFAGFPRTLNAARIWRALIGRDAQPSGDSAGVEPSPSSTDEDNREAWRIRGERMCAIVYGDAYEQLRANVRGLHPALDEWMIVDGYGKVLGRPALDLRTRELAIVASCAAGRQQRQLHSHLHGALNAGASADDVDATLRSLENLLPDRTIGGYRQLLRKVVSARAGRTR